MTTTPSTQGQWENLLQQSMDALETFYKGPGDAPSLAKVKVATSFISSYTRHEATESSREQTALIVGRQLATNPEEFRIFAALALPRVPLPAPPTEEDPQT